MKVEIPESVAAGLNAEGVDPARRLLEDAVAQAYREGKLTKQQVRDALGMTWRLEIDPFLKRYEIYDYTLEELRKDIATLERLWKENEAA